MASEPLVEIDWGEYHKLSPEEQQQIDAAIAQVKEVTQANPLAAYQPYDKQRLFHSALERRRAFFAGSRSGKSTAGVVDDLVQLLPPSLVPHHLLPFKRHGHDGPIKARVITPDLGHTMEVVLDKVRVMCPPKALRGGGWEKAFDKQKRILWFARGDKLDFMSTEQDPNKFGGIDLHRVHFDEEPAGPNSWRIYQDSWTRLTDHRGDLIFTMTPLLGITWVNDHIWEKRAEEGIFCIQASMRENPYLEPGAIDETLAILSEEERRAVEHGEFVHFEGKFFPEFSQRHIAKPPDAELVRSQDIVVGIDPGRETGVVWLAFDRDNAATVFAEAFLKDKTVPEIAEHIKAVNKAWGVEPAYVIDPAARMKRGTEAESIETAFVRQEIFCQLGENNRAAGILEMKRRLQADPPQFMVASNCERLAWEFPRYRRDPNSTKDFEAVKKDDHELDAARYAVMSRTWVVPEPRTHDRASNYNSYTPDYEPPYRDRSVPPAPPLGVFS